MWNFLKISLLSLLFYRFQFLCLIVYQFSRVIHIYPTPPLEQDMTQGQFLSEV